MPGSRWRNRRPPRATPPTTTPDRHGRARGVGESGRSSRQGPPSPAIDPLWRRRHMRITRRVRMAGAVATLLLAAMAAPPEGRAEQFVLFDVTFTFTKADADNARPSKSHYYVKGAKLNPDRPRDWTAPV